MARIGPGGHRSQGSPASDLKGVEGPLVQEAAVLAIKNEPEFIAIDVEAGKVVLELISWPRGKLQRLPWDFQLAGTEERVGLDLHSLATLEHRHLANKAERKIL